MNTGCPKKGPVKLRGGPLFFIGGGRGYLFCKKKLFTSCSWLKKIVCFKVMKGKKLSAKQREIFKNTLIFQNFDTIGLDIKVSFSFI